MKKKAKKVKDKEGVVFMLQTLNDIDQSKIERDSSLYVRAFIDRELARRNVYPINERVGITGEIKTLSFFISGLIEGYVRNKELLIK